MLHKRRKNIFHSNIKPRHLYIYSIQSLFIITYVAILGITYYYYKKQALCKFDYTMKIFHFLVLFDFAVGLIRLESSHASDSFGQNSHRINDRIAFNFGVAKIFFYFSFTHTLFVSSSDDTLTKWSAICIVEDDYNDA